MTLNEEINKIKSDPLLTQDEKIELLKKFMTPIEADMQFHEMTPWKDPEPPILKDPLEGTLYLVIQQEPFNEILAGTKKVESRGFNAKTTYDGGKYIRPCSRLRLAVGYHKNRDEAIVEVTEITTDSFSVHYHIGIILEYKPKV